MIRVSELKEKFVGISVAVLSLKKILLGEELILVLVLRQESPTK